MSLNVSLISYLAQRYIYAECQLAALVYTAYCAIDVPWRSNHVS